MVEDISRDEWLARFKAHMLAIAGSTFHDGYPIADYADDTGPTYFETEWQRAEGPEACAESDIGEWGE